MPDGSDPDSTAPRTDIRSHDDTRTDQTEAEVTLNLDRRTVTFAWRHAENEATAAWITADADLVVAGADMQ